MDNISRELIEKIVKEVIFEETSKKEVNRVVDQSGVLSIKTDTIVPEKFDTGKEGDDVKLIDIISLEESPRLGAGIMEMDNTTFDWTLNYDEVDYIIEGTLEIIIDGRKVVGHKGDTIFIPKNTKIQFSTPNFCRFLYVVYPADWQVK